MSQDIPPPRSALVDVTNHVQKRGFSLIETTSEDPFHLAKKECLRPDNLNNKENCLTIACNVAKASADELKGKAEDKSLGIEHDDDLNITTDSNYIESQESMCGVEGDGKLCMDSIKTCRCSFCIKAGNLLSDLHYQDIKARIAVINKSQKEATILVNRNTRDAARSAHVSNLDSDLTGRWKSLFLHMEDMFVREAAHLETSLSDLKEFTDNCNTHSKIN